MKRRIFVLTIILGIMMLICSCRAGDLKEREPGNTEPAKQSENTPGADTGALKTVSPALRATATPATIRPLPTIDTRETLEDNIAEPNSVAAQQRINFAANDLAQRLGVERSLVQLAAYEETVWRDGSLGCPQPGMMYTQSLVPGYLIQLDVEGETFRYHGAEGRDPFLCDNHDVAPESLPGP